MKTYDVIKAKKQREALDRRNKVVETLRAALQPLAIDEIVLKTGIGAYAVKSVVTTLLAEHLVDETKSETNKRLYELNEGKEFQDILIHRKTNFKPL